MTLSSNSYFEANYSWWINTLGTDKKYKSVHIWLKTSEKWVQCYYNYIILMFWRRLSWYGTCTLVGVTVTAKALLIWCASTEIVAIYISSYLLLEPGIFICEKIFNIQSFNTHYFFFFLKNIVRFYILTCLFKKKRCGKKIN